MINLTFTKNIQNNPWIDNEEWEDVDDLEWDDKRNEFTANKQEKFLLGIIYITTVTLGRIFFSIYDSLRMIKNFELFTSQTAGKKMILKDLMMTTSLVMIYLNLSITKMLRIKTVLRDVTVTQT